MNLAAALIPSTLDAKQALRLRRFGVAALSYVLATVLVAAGWAFGAVPGSTLLEAAAAFVAINAGLYFAIRSGFNLRYEEPSLTRVQILAAITILMYIVYHMDTGREVALFGCFIVFLFGVVRLSAREFALITLYTLAGYALVINLLMHFRPEAILDVRLEWMSWLGLAGFLPCFNIIGAQLNTLRRKLRASESRFRLTFDFAASGIAGVSLDGRFLHVNRKLCVILGRSERELVGSKVKDFSHPEDRDKTDDSRARMRSGEQEPTRFEKRYLRKDGTTVWVDLTLALVRDDKGKPLYEIAVFDDNTERKQSEQAVRAAAQRLRLVADNIPVMTAYWDTSYHCRFASKAFAAAFGLAAEEAVGRHARDIMGDELFRDNETQAQRVLQGHPALFQRTRTFNDGLLGHFEIRLVPDFDDHGKVVGCFSVTIDVTEHKQAEERLMQVANHDGLTGLPNRSLFNDRLGQALILAKRDSSTFAVLYLDLDRFKPVNDALGHAAGDELLKETAIRIRLQVRASDTVARVGGDEFIVILPGIAGRAMAESVAGKIAATVAKPFQLGSPKQRVDIGISIGIAIYPADGQDADALVRAADAAMYSAKHSGDRILPRAA